MRSRDEYINTHGNTSGATRDTWRGYGRREQDTQTGNRADPEGTYGRTATGNTN